LSVWFRTLNRLAPYGVVAPADDDAIDPTHVVRRPFASGLLEVTWTRPRIVLVALGASSIIFDGLSQTVPFGALFGAPTIGPKTLLLIAFLGLVAAAALVVARVVSSGAIGAGLLPIAVGYLVAHYLTYVLIDGQRILIAISDPLQRGDDLFGTAFFTPAVGWLPPGLVWTTQLAAVVGGHMLGAWSGHVTAQQDMAAPAPSRPPRDMRHRKVRTEGSGNGNGTGSRRPGRGGDVRVREIPLAVVMVALTTLTLWSLGQAIVREPAAQGTRPAQVAPA
jgi:hypothetical protein